MRPELRNRVLEFFRDVNNRARANPHAALGHTYFTGINHEVGLTRLWEHQLRFHFDKAYRLDPDGRAAIDRLWDGVVLTTPSNASGADDVGGAEEP